MSEYIKRQEAIGVMAQSYPYESDRMTALQELPVIELDEETSKMIDGITACCGYDFGTDAFGETPPRYCPMCGKKLDLSIAE